MPKDCFKKLSWDFYSKLILLCYFLLQIIRWQIFPRFMDMYYHLHSAWGFIQAGGYSGWDFWQCAPFGRPHIYPPFFHLVLAFFIKLGLDKIIIAKFIETVVPTLFLYSIWLFVKKNYNERLAFFVILAQSSSFSFYLSLGNYIPATLALILGLAAWDQMLNNKVLRCVLLLALSFYTHIGVSCLFALSVFISGLLCRESRKKDISIFIWAVIMAFPILLKQLAAIRLISLANIGEKYFCEFKPIEYALALFGLILVIKMDKRYRIFLSLFLSSFIFLIYPYRFFSAQGYLPLIFFLGLALDGLWQEAGRRGRLFRNSAVLIAAYFLFFSPTLLMESHGPSPKIRYKVYLADSAFSDMLFPLRNKRLTSNSLWFPQVYLPAVRIIKQNSQENDIIFSDLRLIEVCLGSISGRATVDSLLPEIGSARHLDPFSVSKIIILSKDYAVSLGEYIVRKYGLLKIGESKILLFYKNLTPCAKVQVKKASVPFWAVSLIGLLYIISFWQSERIVKVIFRCYKIVKCPLF